MKTKNAGTAERAITQQVCVRVARDTAAAMARGAWATAETVATNCLSSAHRRDLLSVMA